MPKWDFSLPVKIAFSNTVSAKKTLQLSESAPKGAKIKLEFAASDNPGAIEKGAVPQLFAKPLLLKLPWQKANFMLAEIELWSAE